MILDATIFDVDSPGPGYLGLPRARAVGGKHLWTNLSTTKELMPNKFGRLLKSEGGRVPDDYQIILDIEHWPDVERMSTVLQLFKEFYPNRPASHYGFIPKREYWRSLDSASQAYKNWELENTALSEVAEHADSLHPSLYTFYPNRIPWIKYAAANIAQAKRFNKPVLPFLSFTYHDSNTELGGSEIDYSFFKTQLEVCLALADGVIIWGGWKQTFNPSAGWVQAVQEVTAVL
jgi:hypothetical protein